MANKTDAYEKVTDSIIAAIEAGTVPWRKPWRNIGGIGPTSLQTRKPYRGINALLLHFEQQARGYASPYWATFKQAQKIAMGDARKANPGLSDEEIIKQGLCPYYGPRKGEKGTTVVFWKVTKFRDEERPKSGLLRVREFVMKDSYSLDLDGDGLDAAFQRHFEAYRKVFAGCGLDPLAVEASSGAMGGSESIEFMVPSDAGEDWVAACASCGYAANVEKARSQLPAASDGPGLPAPEAFATPGQRTIEEIAGMAGGAPAERQIKTLVYVVGDETLLVLLRGDHALVEQKLKDALGAVEARPAQDEEIRAALGAGAGSLGAVGVSGWLA